MEERFDLPAYIVTGFLDAGKTTFIQSFITGDFFHKKERGSTLIFVFESGETEYDPEMLKKYKTEVEIYESGDIEGFIKNKMKEHLPDRVFVELNCMREGLFEIINSLFKPISITMLINAETLELYYRNMMQMLYDMIGAADPIIINRAKNKESLEKYAAPFRLINKKAGFLWESPLGFHEKVFGRALPFDRDEACIYLKESDYPHWYLDAYEDPLHYRGKTLEADLEIKNSDDEAEGNVFAGRRVMTCCVNDISFFGFRVANEGFSADDGFYHIKADISVEKDYSGKCDSPVFIIREIKKITPPVCAYTGVSGIA